MVKYLVLIYGDEQAWAVAPREWHEANTRAHEAFHAAAGKAIVSANELAPAAAAVSLRRVQPGHRRATARSSTRRR